MEADPWRHFNQVQDAKYRLGHVESVHGETSHTSLLTEYPLRFS